MNVLREIGETTTMPQTPAQQAALSQAGIALAVAISLEAAAGVIAAVAVHETAVLGQVIGAQLAAGATGAAGATAAGVTVGVVLATSLVAIAIGVAIIGAVVLPTLARNLTASHPHGNTPRSGGNEQTEGSGPPPSDIDAVLDSINATGSLTGIVSVDPTGHITITIPNATVPGLSIEAAMEAATIGQSNVTVPDAPGTCCPGFTTGQSIGLSPVDNSDVGFPGEVGLFMVADDLGLDGVDDGFENGDGAERVSWPSALLLFLTAGVGGWYLQRRYA